MWKWIKDIQPIKHKHVYVMGNKNIQSELREAHIRVMEMRVNGQPTSWENEMKRCYESGLWDAQICLTSLKDINWRSMS